MADRKSNLHSLRELTGRLSEMRENGEGSSNEVDQFCKDLSGVKTQLIAVREEIKELMTILKQVREQCLLLIDQKPKPIKKTKSKADTEL